MGIGRVIGGTVAGLGLVGAGYLGVGGLDLDRDETGAITEAGELGAFRIRVGDCVNNAVAEGASTEVETVEGVPCDQPHQAEAYHAFNLPEGDGSFPGDALVAEQADQGCYDAFAGFVGLSYEESALDFTWFVPTAESWASSELRDREVLCFVIDGQLTPLTGTVRSVAR